MRLDEIRIQAQLHIGVKLEPSLAMRYANEGIQHLTNMFDETMYKKQDSITATRLIPADIPEDCASLIRVIDSRGNIVKDREVYDDKIIFDHDGEYTLIYYQTPKILSENTETPEIKKEFHYALSLFIAAREKFRLFGDEDTDSIRLMREFSETANLAANRVRRHGRKGIIPAQHWG